MSYKAALFSSSVPHLQKTAWFAWFAAPGRPPRTNRSSRSSFHLSRTLTYNLNGCLLSDRVVGTLVLAALMIAFTGSAFATDASAMAITIAPSAAKPASEITRPQFWTRKVIALQAVNAALQTADMFQTRYYLDRHIGREVDPIARPFVSQGWTGSAAYFEGIQVGGTILMSYLLHRTGHDRLMHWLPVAMAGSAAWGVTETRIHVE